MSTTITEYSATDSALAELRTKYEAVVFDVTSGKGMEQAKKARAELREHRVSLEKERVRIKAPALERCRQIDSEAKRITAELSALEDPIDEQIKGEEERKARDKEAREQAERERIAAMNARFDAIRALPLAAVGASSAAIAEQIAQAEKIDPASFPGDLQPAAQHEKRLAITALRAAQDRALADEQERERIKAERAELEQLRAAQAALLAEQERLAAAERERVAAEERRLEDLARAEREAIERAEREARDAEQRRIDAERAEARRKEDAERVAEQQRLREERERLEADKKAADKRQREQAIANATLLDAAADAVDLLREKGFADHLTTHRLAAAIEREPAKRKAA
jgi:hypothetical protein